MTVVKKYLKALNGDTHKEFPLRIAIRAEPQGMNKDETGRISGIASLLRHEGIPVSIIGSAAVKMQLGMQLISPHDVDFAIAKDHIAMAENMLRKARYDFWNEDSAHRSIRSMTGGFGKHHNYGFAIPDFLQRHGFPVRLGVFAYEKQGNGTVFYENFAISSFKVDLLFSKLRQERPDIPARILDGAHGKDELRHSIEELPKYGLDFWAAINEKELNAVDMQRRNVLMALEWRKNTGAIGTEGSSENFFEFSMHTAYDSSPEEYLFSCSIKFSEGNVFTVPLEVSYLRYSNLQFSPHFLGSREKYRNYAAMIERSGRLDECRLLRFMDVYETQHKSYELLSEYTFTHDAVLDGRILAMQLRNGMKSIGKEPNYFSLISEGAHYVCEKIE